MCKPVIGITAGQRGDGSIGVPADYVDAVVRSGGVPVMLPRTDDTAAVDAMVQRLDGLLLSGGGDISPGEYGEMPHPKSGSPDLIRDRMEIAATRAAVRRGIPLLGICRGIQVLNVALGGTLVQDIPSQITDARQHNDPAAFPHTIEIEQGTLLARVLGVTSADVSSRHHQAVKALAPGLKANCVAPDGVIEGAEAADGGPVLAVQCHPETLCKAYPLFQKLFDWLVSEAGKNHP